ncbi:uncharacterized protein LOC134251235 [Saccostrea cucullata]|uniref:uncharacterized protein LOC134251235 n=1 Tax=Saccostrea cuccullata TaxID=36930 RepID=UPI002ED54CE5
MKNCILLLCFIVSVKSFLTITQQASKGRTAILECEYPIETIVVQWSRVGIGILTTCNIPGTCLPMENTRYSANVSRSLSNFIIKDSRYEDDTGNWTCTVNSTAHSRVATQQVIVSTLPSSFHFVKGPVSQIIMPDEGLDLEAKAVCVYPKPHDVFLYYKIKGDDTFNLFQKRNAKMYFAPGNDQNCAVHEYELLAKFNIQKEDFLDLTLSFRMQYRALTGADVSSVETPYVIFPGYPCQIKPCRNGGTCRVLSFTHYVCSCVDRYTGKNCETPVDPCVSDPCQNYGICHGNKDHYTFECRCEQGFSGKTCEQKADTSGSYLKGTVYLFWMIMAGNMYHLFWRVLF